MEPVAECGTRPRGTNPAFRKPRHPGYLVPLYQLYRLYQPFQTHCRKMVHPPQEPPA